MTLHFTYAALGITADPRAVDLVVVNERIDKRTIYGGLDPSWSGTVFNGHCVLRLPGSGRFVDPTVERYSDVRRYQLGPICGRIAASMATPAQQARMAAGELIPGSQVEVRREDLLLLYTTVGHEFDDIVMTSATVRDKLHEFHNAGRNLAMKTLAFLSQPEVIERARQTPHRRVRALLDVLDVLDGADLNDDDDHELRFVRHGDPTRTPRGLDELTRLTTASISP